MCSRNELKPFPNTFWNVRFYQDFEDIFKIFGFFSLFSYTTLWLPVQTLSAKHKRLMVEMFDFDKPEGFYWMYRTFEVSKGASKKWIFNDLPSYKSDASNCEYCGKNQWSALSYREDCVQISRQNFFKAKFWNFPTIWILMKQSINRSFLSWSSIQLWCLWSRPCWKEKKTVTEDYLHWETR